jgi:hypothetical protein
MQGTSTKLTAAAAAGAVGIIIVWAVSLTGMAIPESVSQAFVLLLALVFGWVAKERATFFEPADDSVKTPVPVVSRTGVVSTPVQASPTVLPVIPPNTNR